MEDVTSVVDTIYNLIEDCKSIMDTDTATQTTDFVDCFFKLKEARKKLVCFVGENETQAIFDTAYQAVFQPPQPSYSPVDVTTIRPGETVLYRLRPIDMPIHPLRVWSGKVIVAVPATDWTTPYLIVQSLEPGYEGMREIIHPPHIISVERSET